MGEIFLWSGELHEFCFWYIKIAITLIHEQSPAVE